MGPILSVFGKIESFRDSRLMEEDENREDDDNDDDNCGEIETGEAIIECFDDVST